MKRVLFFLFFVSFCLCIPVLVKRSTHGFRVGKLAMSPLYNSAWDVGVTNELQERVQLLLAQTFFYKGRGSQAYAFESEDGRFILKLFRSDPRTHLWDRCPLGSREKLERLFTAARLAFTKGIDLTGLLYVHINTTQKVLPVVQVKDRWRRSHFLDLNQYCFALQYQGLPVREAFREAFAKNNGDEVKGLIDSFMHLLSTRANRLIGNADRSVSGNFGFLNGRAIEWDFGNYRLDETLAQVEARKKELEPFLSQLRHFLEKEGPLWLEYYDAQAAAF